MDPKNKVLHAWLNQQCDNEHQVRERRSSTKNLRSSTLLHHEKHPFSPRPCFDIFCIRSSGRSLWIAAGTSCSAAFFVLCWLWLPFATPQKKLKKLERSWIQEQRPQVKRHLGDGSATPPPAGTLWSPPSWKAEKLSPQLGLPPRHWAQPRGTQIRHENHLRPHLRGVLRRGAAEGFEETLPGALLRTAQNSCLNSWRKGWRENKEEFERNILRSEIEMKVEREEIVADIDLKLKRNSSTPSTESSNLSSLGTSAIPTPLSQSTAPPYCPPSSRGTLCQHPPQQEISPFK